MKRRSQVALLARIAEIRDLQRTAAEAQAVRAAAARRDAEDLRALEEDRLLSVEQGWRNSLVEKRGCTDLTMLWSVELMRQAGVSRAAEAERDEAAAEADRKRRDWMSALMRRDAARDMAGDAARRLARYREEKALADSSDRHAHRKIVR